MEAKNMENLDYVGLSRDNEKFSQAMLEKFDKFLAANRKRLGR